METWFTSDLHLGHARISELAGRPFSSVDEMNEAIIANWNERVQPEDRVYVLGDVALGKIAESLPLVKRLKGNKYLIPGNHDRCWSGHKKRREIDITRYEDVGFIVLPGIVSVHRADASGGWRFRMCHFPYEGDSHDEDRYVEYRPVPQYPGEILIHGHVHEKWKVNGNQINVGVDVWDFRPVHEDEIRVIIGS